jgi:hypothetical protein
MILVSTLLVAACQAALAPSPPEATASAADPARGVIDPAVAWLASQQDEAGWWRGATPGLWPREQRIGVTALALLALQADGNTLREGPHKEAVARGLGFLRDQQDPESGLIGDQLGHAFMYDHALATLALVDAYGAAQSPLVKRTAQSALNYVAKARNPYGAWRYDVPPIGDNDTSITFWCALALHTGQRAGLKIDTSAFDGTLAWLDQVTDPNTGRTGYDTIGSTSSRIAGINERFPADHYEAMTGAAIALRALLRPADTKLASLARPRELLERALPTVEQLDTMAFHHCTLAAFLLGGRTWERWSNALLDALTAHQAIQKDGRLPASNDVWGRIHGAVGTTALAVLALHVPARFADRRLLGTLDERAPDSSTPPLEIAAPSDVEVAAEPAYGGLVSPERAALAWLRGAQAEDGSWPAEDRDPCKTVATTALSVLALDELVDEPGGRGIERVVHAGVAFLREQQDMDSGLVGPSVGVSFHYAHALATLAFAKTLPPVAAESGQHEALQRAALYALRARNPYGAWRYDMPPIGDNDTSVTAWMVLALVAAEEAGAKLDTQAYDGAIAWFDAMTELTSGRTGYTERGGASSRIEGRNDDFPPDNAETMTAAALAARRALGRLPAEAVLVAQRRLLDRTPVVGRAPDARGGDALYWYFGTLALRGDVSATGARWRAGLVVELAAAQVADGPNLGSWDPSGPWGFALGRTGTTALALLALEAAK